MKMVVRLLRENVKHALVPFYFALNAPSWEKQTACQDQGLVCWKGHHEESADYKYMCVRLLHLQ